MKAVGIICEYNPFHNGHLYHIEKVKELFPDDVLVLVLSGNVTERGELSILSKWEKTEIALTFGVDLVIELPFVFSSQSADTFCYGAVKLLHHIGVEKLVFGSELGNTETLITCAKTQLYSHEYQNKVKKYLKDGINYPSSLAKALEEETGINISTPNDLLGLGYVKEIIKSHYAIEPITIKRTNNYHSERLTGRISSATSIRKSLKEKISVEDTIPPLVLKYLTNTVFLEDFFPYLKYKILSEEHLEIYETVDDKICNRLKSKILDSNNLEDFINQTKTKYYTYNRLMRMCSHILFSFTKEENKVLRKQLYIRILGFSELGRNYLHQKKKEITIPIITNYSNDSQNLLALEIRITKILSLVKGKEFLEEEIKRKPIYKKEGA